VRVFLYPSNSQNSRKKNYIFFSQKSTI